MPPAMGCLYVADTNFQMPVTFVAATNEGQVDGNSDAPGCDYRLGTRDGTKLRADLERMGA